MICRCAPDFIGAGPFECLVGVGSNEAVHGPAGDVCVILGRSRGYRQRRDVIIDLIIARFRKSIHQIEIDIRENASPLSVRVSSAFFARASR